MTIRSYGMQFETKHIEMRSSRTRLLVMRKYRKKEKMKMGELMVKIKEEVEELFWEREALVDFYRQAKGQKKNGAEAGGEEEDVQKGEA